MACRQLNAELEARVREGTAELALAARVIEATSQGVLITDATGRVIQVNPAYVRLSGYTADTLIGHRHCGLLFDHEQDAFNRSIWDSLQHTGRWSGDLWNEREDGTFYLERLTIDLVRGEDGEPAHYVILVNDATEQWRSEEQLRQNEAHLKRTQEVAHTGGWVMDFAQDTLEWTDETYRIFNIPLSRSLNPTDFFASVFPEDREFLDRAWQRALAGAPFDCEHRILAGQQLRWVRQRAEITFDEEGVPRAVYGAIQDITSQHEAQLALKEYREQLEALVQARTAELREAEERLRLILESSADGLYGLDPRGLVTFVNPAACALLGYSAAELLGSNMHDRVHDRYPDGRPYPEQECSVLAVLRGGNMTRRSDEVFWRADQTPLPVTYASRPMLKDGRIVGAVVSFADITAQREAGRLREQALREAERLARVRSEFLANMSHEIRTPLNAVLGLAQVGVRESQEARALASFSRILDSGQLLLGIVNDILDFSKIEAGKLKIEHLPFNLGQMLDSVIELVAPRAYDQGLQLMVEEAPGLPSQCRGDALRLAQILVNLLSNAIKFTRQGQVSLHVFQDGPELIWRVRDTGIGMTAEQQARLFMPFEQAEDSTSRKFGGTGLGLTICQRLCQLMNGRLIVESTAGVGSQFDLRINLPVIETAQSSARSLHILLCGLHGQEAGALESGLSAIHAAVTLARAVPEPLPAADLVLITPELLERPTSHAVVAAACARGPLVAAILTPGRAQNRPGLEGLQVVERPLRPRQILRLIDAPVLSVTAPRRQRLAGIRVLAAEDNEVNQLVLKDILRIEGASLECENDGQAMIERLKSVGPVAYDVLLVDIQMPILDGYATARLAQQMAPLLPVIGLTAHTMEEERGRCLAAGMVEHVSKPIMVDDLVAAILRRVPQPLAHVAERAAGLVPGPGPEQASSGALTRPPSLRMLDWSALVGRFHGRTEFVGKLLRSVIETQANTPLQLREAVQAGDAERLRFLSHALRGVTGQLMISELQQLATQCEQGAARHDPDVGHQGLMLASQLDELMAEIRIVLKTVQRTSFPEPEQ